MSILIRNTNNLWRKSILLVRITKSDKMYSRKVIYMKKLFNISLIVILLEGSLLSANQKNNEVKSTGPLANNVCFSY